MWRGWLWRLQSDYKGKASARGDGAWTVLAGVMGCLVDTAEGVKMVIPAIVKHL